MTISNNQSISFRDVLKENNIYIENKLKSRQDILKFGSQKISNYIKNICSPKVLYEKLLEVDKLNVVLENGLFLPHAKFQDLDRIYSILIITPKGIKDDSSDFNIFVSYFFLSPLKPSFFQTHLNLLSHVAQIFKKEFIDNLKNLTLASDIYKMIIAAEKQYERKD